MPPRRRRRTKTPNIVRESLVYKGRPNIVRYSRIYKEPPKPLWDRIMDALGLSEPDKPRRKRRKR